MRARYKDRPEKSTNGVGVVTPLQTFYGLGKRVLTFLSLIRKKIIIYTQMKIFDPRTHSFTLQRPHAVSANTNKSNTHIIQSIYKQTQ